MQYPIIRPPSDATRNKLKAANIPTPPLTPRGKVYGGISAGYAEQCIYYALDTRVAEFHHAAKEFRDELLYEVSHVGTNEMTLPTADVFRPIEAATAALLTCKEDIIIQRRNRNQKRWGGELASHHIVPGDFPKDNTP